jgi:hypothetical protein
MARADGEFWVNDSNRLEFSLREARPSFSGPPRVVPWRAGSRTVLVASVLPSSVRLVTPAGEVLPAEAFDCRLIEDGPLRNRVTFCTVSAPSPLSPGWSALRRVRAQVENVGEVELTSEVDIP